MYRSVLDFTKPYGQRVAAYLLDPTLTDSAIARQLGIKTHSVTAYRYGYNKWAARQTTKPRTTDRPTATQYPNGGVSMAMAELRAEAARIQAAITALEAVTLTKSTQ